MATITTTFAIDALAVRYGFDKDEALRFIRQSLADELTKMATAPAVDASAQPAGSTSPKPTPRTRPTPKPRKRMSPPTAEPVQTPTQPIVAEPVVAEPIVAEPVVAEPVVAEPAAAVPAPVAKPGPATKPKILKPTMLLPWCGKALDGRCQAVSFSYSLYTQCMNAPGNDGKLCKACHKNVNDAGMPKFGFITERAANPEWTAPDGKQPQRYVQFWSKRLESKGITREQVEAEAAKFGFTVPDSEWILPEKATRKRKEKTTIAASSASGSDNDAAAAPAPKVKKLTKTKNTPPPPPPVQPAAPASTTGTLSSGVLGDDDGIPDMVQESLANGLTEDPYDMETDEEYEEMELNVSMKEIDHNDGQGPRTALVDGDNGNVYCYLAFMATGDTKKVGTFANSVFTPTSE